ncbi:hypothetical protein D9M71_684410 [compost metagenome]
MRVISMVSTEVSRAMNGIFCARRMRATIWPMRPMPAITTRGVSVWICLYCSGTSRAGCGRLRARAQPSISSGVMAIDRVMVISSRS